MAAVRHLEMKNYSRNPFGFSRWEKCRSRCLAVLTGTLLAGLAGCKQDPPVTTLESLITNLPPPAVESTNPPAAPTSAVPFYGYEVVNTYPHDRGAFTQGLVFLKGELLESTGLNGQSSLRRVDLKTGRVLQTPPAAQTNDYDLVGSDGGVFVFGGGFFGNDAVRGGPGGVGQPRVSTHMAESEGLRL